MRTAIADTLVGDDTIVNTLFHARARPPTVTPICEAVRGQGRST